MSPYDLLEAWRDEAREAHPSDAMLINKKIRELEAVLRQAGEVSEVTRQLIERDQRGRAKYGTSLDRTDMSLPDWLQHMAEELLDAAGYALAAKRDALRENGAPAQQIDVHGLPAKWRREAERDSVDEVEVQLLNYCADELESALRQSGEAVAYCDASDPSNASAFAWPGTDRHERHSTPLYLVTPATSGLVELVRREIEAAKRELDTVTATDDAQSDGIGCAESALDRALAAIAAHGIEAPGADTSGLVVDDAMVERALKRQAIYEDGAEWLSAYSEGEQALERKRMRLLLEAALADHDARGGR